LLAELTLADYANGVKLYVQVTPTSAPVNSVGGIYVQCEYALTVVTAVRERFPTDPGAPQGILKNPDFGLPFTGNENTGWAASPGWTRDDANNLAVATSTGGFLFQRADGYVTGARYYVKVIIVPRPDGLPTAGSLYFLSDVANVPVLLGSAPGTYTYEFTANVAERVHIYPGAGGQFTGAVSLFDIYRVQ